MEAYRAHFFNNALVATNRGQRPHIDKQSQACPFCESYKEALELIYHEAWVEGQLCARIVANKYPIVNTVQGPYGFHDVVIDTSSHLEHPKDFTRQHWQSLLIALKQRWQELSQDERIHFIQLFKNYGVLAGASIHHSHWQIVALEEIPFGMIQQYKKYHEVADEECFLCSQTHLQEAYRVAETDAWRIIVPPEPIMAYEVWLVPKRHCTHYGELNEMELNELGIWLKRLLMAYHLLIPKSDFNICMMSGDLDKKWMYHFHVKLMLRVGHIAGFELATHCYMMTLAAKEYANNLKILIKKQEMNACSKF